MIKRLPYCLLLAAACAAPIEKPALEDPDFATDSREDRISGGARVIADVGFPDSVTTGRFGSSQSPVGYTLTVWAPTNGVKIGAKSLDGDTVLSVYGPFRTSWSAAARVGYNDDAPGLGTDSALSLNLRSAGKYLVIVREYSNGAGAFTLTVGNPEVPARCGGLIGAQCAAGQFCDYAIEDHCGAADAMGTCRSIPTVCTREFRPVCGCDDVTYSNPCNARASGVAVAKDGECGPAFDCSAPNACGPERHYSPRVCGDGTVIYGRASCVLDGDSCQWRYDAPECPAPVLDCSAPNACGPERHYSPRVCDDGSVIYGRASCVQNGSACQWRYDAPECPAPVLDCSAPNACGPERHYSPRVCDDGTVIYGRASCVLDGDSCRWRYDAPECTAPARCGGLAGFTCPADENVYCHYETTQNCGRFDQMGTCRTKPTACTRDFRPVCGCDGRTYSNACNAAASGVSIVASGSCAR